MCNLSKANLQNFLSVIAGVSVTILVSILLLIGLFITGIFKLKEWGLTNNISYIIILIIPGFLGGYTTARISTRKHGVYVFITVLVMIAFHLFIEDFVFNSLYYDDYLFLIGSSGFIFFGGWVGLKHKKIILSNNSSSPTDIVEK